MDCGCALSSTDYSAVYEYAEDGMNCLLSPVGDVGMQADCVVRLFEDDVLMHSIVSNAVRTASRFSYNIASDRFLSVIMS